MFSEPCDEVMFLFFPFHSGLGASRSLLATAETRKEMAEDWKQEKRKDKKKERIESANEKTSF